MKKHISLLLAALSVGVFFFFIWYYVFGKDYDTAMSYGIIAAVAGLVAEYIKPLFSKKRK